MTRTKYIAYTWFLSDRINYFFNFNFISDTLYNQNLLGKRFFSGFESFRGLVEAGKLFGGEPDHTLSLKHLVRNWLVYFLSEWFWYLSQIKNIQSAEARRHKCTTFGFNPHRHSIVDSKVLISYDWGIWEAKMAKNLLCGTRLGPGTCWKHIA